LRAVDQAPWKDGQMVQVFVNEEEKGFFGFGTAAGQKSDDECSAWLRQRLRSRLCQRQISAPALWHSGKMHNPLAALISPLLRCAMRFLRRTSHFLSVLFCVLALHVATSWGSEKEGKPIRTWDLRQFGYSREQADYSVAGFLSENLLLVAINQRPVTYPHPLFEDAPEATLVLFDVGTGVPLRRTRMPMSKSNYSIAPVLQDQFVVLTSSEVKLCSVDFQCNQSFSSKGPLKVTRDRTRAVVGGNLMTQEVVLDLRTMTPATEAIDEPAKTPEQCATHYRGGSFATCLSSVNDERLMVVEVKQTGWNKFTNPLAGFGDRPYNSQRIIVYEKRTGAERFTLHWDPRKLGGSLTTLPALSPTGHEVALIRRGVLEVFDVP
jgi:hypothetical protein